MPHALTDMHCQILIETKILFIDTTKFNDILLLEISSINILIIRTTQACSRFCYLSLSVACT